MPYDRSVSMGEEGRYYCGDLLSFSSPLHRGVFNKGNPPERRTDFMADATAYQCPDRNAVQLR